MSLHDIYEKSPFEIEGNCYSVDGSSIKLLSRNQIFFQMSYQKDDDENYIHLNFGNNPAPICEIGAIIKAQKPYIQKVFGEEDEFIPSFKVLTFYKTEKIQKIESIINGKKEDVPSE